MDSRILYAIELESRASIILDMIGAAGEAERLRRHAALYRYFSSDEWRAVYFRSRGMVRL